MAVDAAHASALVQLAVLVDSLELDGHAAPFDCRDMVATPAAPRSMTGADRWQLRAGRRASPTNGHEAAGNADGSCRWLIAGKLPRFLVALLPVRGLLLCAKHLFVKAKVPIVPARAGQR